MGADIVGPVPTIRFTDNSTQTYAPPLNTVDPRSLSCADHHPGCDCREAELNETIAEFRAERQAAVDKAADVLRGHATYAWEIDPGTGEQIDVSCMCTGCQIARAGYLRPINNQIRERHELKMARPAAQNGTAS